MRIGMLFFLYIYPWNVHANVIRHLDCCCEVLSMLLAIFSHSKPSLSVQTNIFAILDTKPRLRLRLRLRISEA